LKELEHFVMRQKADQLHGGELADIVQTGAPQCGHHGEQVVGAKGGTVLVIAQVLLHRHVPARIVLVQ
jgi:hypothetical protein